MGHEHWFRVQHDGQGRSFDWLTLAQRHGVPGGLARSLYKLAIQLTLKRSLYGER